MSAVESRRGEPVQPQAPPAGDDQIAKDPPCVPLSLCMALLAWMTLVDFPLTMVNLLSTDLDHGMQRTDFALKILSYAILAKLCARKLAGKPKKCFSLQMFCCLFTLASIMQLFSDGHGEALIAWDYHSAHYHVGLTYIHFPALSTMLTPILFMVIFHNMLEGLVLALWAACLVALAVAAAIDGSSLSGIAVAYYFLLSSLLFYSIRQQKRVSMHCQLHQERANEEQIQEFDRNTKNLVGNVAHDLKTPLASFMAGVDLIQELAREAMSLMEPGSHDGGDGLLGERLVAILQCARTIRNTNSFMVMSINRCIDYTKASKGLKLQPTRETIDLLETLSLPLNCMKDIQHEVQIQMSSLEEHICSHIITDGQWLQENVLCLLSNAVKYSSGGSVDVRVSLIEGDGAESAPGGASSESSVATRIKGYKSAKVAPSLLSVRTSGPVGGGVGGGVGGLPDDLAAPDGCHHMLLVEVEDSGIGMTEEAMASLFSPFQQTQRLAGGTGLGLYSLANRVAALNGQCGVAMRPDGLQGSLFWFAVPYVPDRQYADIHRAPSLLCELPTDAEREMPMTEWLGRRREGSVCTLDSSRDSMWDSQSVGSARPQRVLLVEDSPSMSKIMASLLTRAGYHVQTAANGAVMLEIVERELFTQARAGSATRVAFDFVLSDLQMPVMDGLEAAKRLRALEGGQPARLHHLVIAVSANDDEETRQACQQCGFDGFIPKPFSVDVLRRELRRLGGLPA